MTASGPLFLDLRAVDKSFGDHRAVVDCNLTVDEGEFVTLLGPSGCGKTTTLRLIAGLLRPDSGEIHFDGTVLSSPATHVPPEMRNMGLVFQSFAVWPHMSVQDNIGLPLRVRGRPRSEIADRVGRVVRLCRLEGFETRHPHQLSGGQLQRVALARALVYEPRLLLLDEPLSNLDAALREEMRHELRGLHRAIGTTFILVTHDQVEAMSLSNRVVVMNAGRVEQIGAPEEVYRAPASDFVAQFVGGANLLSGRAAEAESGAAGELDVRVGNITLLARGAPRRPADAACRIAIHPELVRISAVDEAEAARNSFLGTVVEDYFLGRMHQTVVDVRGLEIRAFTTRSERLKPGDRVRVTIPPEALILY